MFSDTACKRVGLYVYRLIDPRNGETFYVGRGRDNRVFNHAVGNIESDDEEDAVSAKLWRISDIKAAGLEVLHVIHRHDIPSEESAWEVEAALIDAYSGLTNVQGGYGSGDRGPMNHREIEHKYGLPSLEVRDSDRLVLININKVGNQYSVQEVYDQVRYAWRIDADRASRADFVLAVVKGIVVGAFEVDFWMTATHDNFPDLLPKRDEKPERFGFTGKPANGEEWQRFVGTNGRRIADDRLKQVRNPIRYWNV